MGIPDFLNTRLPLFSIRVRGKWKNSKIFQVINGKQFLRAYTVYDGSAKGHLIKFQSKFAAAVWNWQQMAYNDRRFYISRASKLGLRISGYNYFISLYMRDKLEGYMGYPDPHHLSHEKGGADEIDVTDLVGTTPRALLGDSTKGRTLRKAYLKILDGTNTDSIAVEMEARWNGDGFVKQDNILKGGGTALVGLHSSGGIVILKDGCFTGDIVSMLRVSIAQNLTGTPLTVRGFRLTNTGRLALFEANTGNAVDLSTLINAGDIYMEVLYITSE